MDESNKPQASQNPNIVARYSETYFGPLPHPELLARYDELIPNGAERIMRMAEKEQDSRHEEDRTITRAEIALAKRGQLFGFCLVLILIAVAVYSLFLGFTIPASVIFGTTIIGVVAIFVKSGREQKNPHQTK